MVAGEKDAVLPLEKMREVAGLIPGAESCVLPEVGHYSHFEAPEKYNQVVDDCYIPTSAVACFCDVPVTAIGSNTY